jgi:hypothetical protein
MLGYPPLSKIFAAHFMMAKGMLASKLFSQSKPQISFGLRFDKARVFFS